MVSMAKKLRILLHALPELAQVISPIILRDLTRIPDDASNQFISSVFYKHRNVINTCYGFHCDVVI